MRSLCVLAVLLCLVGLAAGASIHAQQWQTSATCEGQTMMDANGIPSGFCVEMGTTSTKYECSGNTATVSRYTSGDCSGTPTTKTFNSGECTTSTEAGVAAEKYTCGAAAQSISALLLLALAFMAGKAKEAL